jgi:polyisoprenoid-binding protein YceI
MSKQARRPPLWLRWLQWTGAIIAGIVVLIFMVTTIYVHLVRVPAMLTLPKVSGAPSSQSTVDGVWNVGPGSIVGWRVQQVVFGQQSPLVGRTTKVWGSLTVSSGSVTWGTFTADMAALTSSLSKTTQRTVFHVSAYPTAMLVLTSPIALGSIPGNGVVERFPADGNLTLHGMTHTVHFTASAERAGGDVYVLADIAFPYGDWNIRVQGVLFLAGLQSPATIEVLLHLTKAAGNSASMAS